MSSLSRTNLPVSQAKVGGKCRRWSRICRKRLSTVTQIGKQFNFLKKLPLRNQRRRGQMYRWSKSRRWRMKSPKKTSAQFQTTNITRNLISKDLLKNRSPSLNLFPTTKRKSLFILFQQTRSGENKYKTRKKGSFLSISRGPSVMQWVNS